MCTLTVLALPGDRVRLAMNRDEQRTRAAALPPVARQIGCRTAVLPIDPTTGGTWLAVNDAGLALALLNVNPQDPKFDRPARSRGTIIPALLESATPAAALSLLEQTIRYTDYAPFRLVLIGSGIGADVRWDGRESMVLNRLVGGVPLLFTSSGLGDHVVEGVRREHFEQLMNCPPDRWEQAQDEFHRNRWPDRPHLSVNMARDDACTVSHAVIELGVRSATFIYHPDAPDGPTSRHIVHLHYATPGAA